MFLTGIKSVFGARSVNETHEGGLGLANAQKLASKWGDLPSTGRC